MKQISSTAKLQAALAGVSRRPMAWVWATVLAAILICGSVAWLQYRQRQLSEQYAGALAHLRQARIDLAKGYLHAALGGTPQSPFDRTQGLALLTQAVSSLDAALASTRAIPQPDAGRTQPLAEFTKVIGQFRGQLALWHGKSGDNPWLETELRNTFFVLERQADTVDRQIQNDLVRLARWNSSLFVGVLWLAVVLLTGICGAVYAGGRKQRQAEAALRENEARFRAITSHTPDHILMQDRDLRYQWVVNPQLGLTEADMIGKTDQDILGKEDAEKLTAIKRKVLETGQPAQLEVPVRNLEGGIEYFEGAYIPKFDASGQADGLIGYFRNITERKQAEEALRKRTRQLEAVRAVSEEITRELRLPSLLELIDRRAGELVGATVGAIHLWDEGTQVLIPQVWHGLGAWFEEVRYKLGEGVVGTVAERREGMIVNDYPTSPYAYPPVLEHIAITAGLAEPLLYRDQLVGVITLSHTEPGRQFIQDDRDLLALLAAQAAIAIENARLYEVSRQYAATLEQRVAERTAELSDRVAEVETLNKGMTNLLEDLNAAYRRAEVSARQLQTVNEELEAFSYSISHDLRAPLRAISGFAEILVRRHRASLNEEGQRYLGNVIQASANMGRLIDDLLAYSRLGREALRHEPIALGKLLGGVAADLAGRVAERKGRLHIPDDLPVVSGDPTLLRQLLTNLLENALTYCRPDIPPEVAVGCEAHAGHVIIRVTDNGIGIPAEHHDKIFHVFQRLHSDDEYPGTGIGLAIVKKAAELHGGRVWVESTVGQGSTFWVQLAKE